MDIHWTQSIFTVSACRTSIEYSDVVVVCSVRRQRKVGKKPVAQTDIVADEIEVVARSEGHGGSAPLGQTGVGLVQRLVDVDKGVDTRLSVRGRSGEVGVRQGHHVWGHVLQQREREGDITRHGDTRDHEH